MVETRAGDDGIFVGAAMDAGDRIDGGAGTVDQVGFQGSYATQVVLATDTICAVEMLVLLPGDDTRFGGGGALFSYVLQMGDGNIAPGGMMLIQANTLRAGETLTLAASGTSGSYTVFLGAGDDRIFTGNGNDRLSGGAGNDELFGSFGADVLTGGAGDDVFVFERGHSTVAAPDRIVDFVHGDRIDLRGAGLTQFSAAGSIAAGQVRAVFNGSVWLIEGDTDSDGTVDLSIEVAQSADFVWAPADFIFS